jgi:GTP-binding protein HflX
MQTDRQENPQYAMAASVQLPRVSDAEFEASLTALRELAKTLPVGKGPPCKPERRH